MGLPTAPSRSFAPPDSVVTELLGGPGYQATRYRADSATVFVQDERVLLEGQGADRAAGLARSRPTPSPTGGTAACWTRTASPSCSTGARC